MSNMFSDRVITNYATGSDAAPVDFSLEVYRSMGEIEVTLSAELGRRLISVQELLRLRVDDVLVLSRPTGENVDLFAGDVLIGNAEILATDEKLAIRVSDLLDKPAASLSQDPGSKQSLVPPIVRKGHL